VKPERSPRPPEATINLLSRFLRRPHRLADCEREACSRAFRPIRADTCEAFARSVSGAWSQPGSAEREQDQLAKLAHALLIVERPGDALPSVGAVIFAARLDALAAQRAVLRNLTACSPSAPPLCSPEVRAWIERRVAAPKSEAATRGHSDAIALDCLDPLSLPHEDATQGFSAIRAVAAPAHLLTMQPPEVATKAAERAKSWTSPQTAREWSVVALSIFDYACRQTHGKGACRPL